MMIKASFLSILLISSPAFANCLRTVIIGDSQMAYGVSPFHLNRTLDPSEISTFSLDSLGTYLYRYFSKNNCQESVFLFSQGGSGVRDWIAEGGVPFINSSRMIFQPGFSWMTMSASSLSSHQQSVLNIGPMSLIVDQLNWFKPDQIIIGLSANDWSMSEEELKIKYSKLLRQARGNEIDGSLRRCYLMGVVGAIGSKTKSMRYPHEPASQTDINVKKLVDVISKVTKESGCIYTYTNSVTPSEPDGLHLGGISALQAFESFKIQYEESLENLKE